MTTPLLKAMSQVALACVSNNTSMENQEEMPEGEVNASQSQSLGRRGDVPTGTQGLALNDLSQSSLLTQNMFCTPDFITPQDNVVNNYFEEDGKENEGAAMRVISPGKLTPQRVVKRLRPSGLSQNSTQTSLLSSDNEQSTQGTKRMEKTALNFSSGGGSAMSKPHTSYIAPNRLKLKCSGLSRRIKSPPTYKNPFIDRKSRDDNVASLTYKGRSPLHSVSSLYNAPRMQREFKELKEIGRGSFSKVVLALHRLDGCEYAIKKLNSRLHTDGDLRQILLEIQAMAITGCHRNIVRYYGSWIETEKLHIQMELCTGTLRSRIDDEKEIEEEKLLILIRDISLALRHLHRRGMAHLDVKPDNIYIGNEGEYKLGDFGSAASLDGGTLIKEGDSRYLPKEMMNDDYSALGKVDIFALGMTALETASKVALPTSGSKYEAMREGKLPLLANISVPTQKLIQRMCAEDPSSRPSAGELCTNSLLTNCDL